jgi:hypothetical protein
MPKQYRIRIRGKQREDVDIDLLAQALLMIAEDLQTREDDKNDQPPEAKPKASS